MKTNAFGIVASFLALALTGCQSMDGHEGAVLGGAAGAAGGALIGSAAAGSGNRGTGAVIGAAVGGAAGAVAGDQLHDKKK
ncbi:MAG: glycine zipper domain-containing protein [Kiritimatiellae bacterium]|nr:glycine zipper domain-containing protein [Kiritimatiellia bacterium]MDD3544267.1 glycine zipper domain-containing protein [Kiritimatiellia bacterium]MDD4026232.1 glycine zipper domain-containing protein [Kiritimatiellia bacterium]MDD4622643.1 glycine zipper domain-containing protein [Kiritimatiellia bacterium]